MNTCACGCGQPTKKTWAHGHNPKGSPVNKIGPPLTEDRGYRTPCLIWQGVPSPQGYGRSWHEGKQDSVHRIVWVKTYGPIPDGLVLDHLCNQKMCVNPEHLEPVTRGENVRRANSRGGGLNPKVKLSQEQVDEIRSREFQSQQKIAREFGISQAHVSKLRRGLPTRRGAKLTDEQRAQIRVDVRRNVQIAREFGVSSSLIDKIKAGNA